MTVPTPCVTRSSSGRRWSTPLASAERRGRPRVLVWVFALSGPAAPALGQARTRGAPGDLIERGRELFEDQQYEVSIQTLSGALVRPNSTRAAEARHVHCLLAKDHITLGNSDEAETFVRALLALEPSDELPERESPRVRDFFAAARERWEREGRPGVDTEQGAQRRRSTLRHRIRPQKRPPRRRSC